jgi:alkylhydroperoxidase family enzyme
MSAPSAESILARRPELVGPYRDYVQLIWSNDSVSPVLLELCRLRIATLLGHDGEQSRRTAAATDAGLTEEKIAALPRWPVDARFDDQERAVLELAELFSMDVHSVSDEQVAAVARYLDPPGLLALVVSLGFFEAFMRMELLFTTDEVT